MYMWMWIYDAGCDAGCESECECDAEYYYYCQDSRFIFILKGKLQKEYDIIHVDVIHTHVHSYSCAFTLMCIHTNISLCIIFSLPKEIIIVFSIKCTLKCIRYHFLHKVILKSLAKLNANQKVKVSELMIRLKWI